MNSRSLAIYHTLPYFARVAAASARGYQLRSWRFGAETDSLIEQACDREHWTPAQWEAAAVFTRWESLKQRGASAA